MQTSLDLKENYAFKVLAYKKIVKSKISKSKKKAKKRNSKLGFWDCINFKKKKHQMHSSNPTLSKKRRKIKVTGKLTIAVNHDKCPEQLIPALPKMTINIQIWRFYNFLTVLVMWWWFTYYNIGFIISNRGLHERSSSLESPSKSAKFVAKQF